MNEIYIKLNEKTGGAYKDIRLSKLVFGASRAMATAVCRAEDYERINSQKSELARYISQICAFNTPIDVEVVSEKSDETALRDDVIAFAKKFPYIAIAANGIAVSGDTVRLKMHESMISLAKDDFLPRLNEYLENSYIGKISVEVDKEEFHSDDERETAEKKIKTSYAIKNVTPVLGSTEACEALSAADTSDVTSAAGVQGNNDDLAVCGLLVMPTDYLSKGGGVKRSRRYERFLLADGEHTLQCRFFPSGEHTVIGSELIGKTVCVFGNTQVERGRTGECAMLARAIAVCDIDGFEIQELKPEPTEYGAVKPEQYSEYVQASLFESGGALPESLRGVFVAFDFETTGLSIQYDKPTELGAVKIVDGVITETFHTMIDPKRPIPEEVSKKTGITDDMVKGMPTIEKVLPDFYKFTYGCSLIGHNIAFDFPFLLKHGHRAGWSFADRKTFDTMGMAPRAISGIDVLTLDSVLTALGLVNDNAHRALSDATATAKAFIAMNKILSHC